MLTREDRQTLYNIQSVAQFLEYFFSSREELIIFCYDYYRKVYQGLSEAVEPQTIVTDLINYCETVGGLGKLRGQLKQLQPETILYWPTSPKTVKQWKEQIVDFVPGFAAIATTVNDISFEQGILAANILWPLRRTESRNWEIIQKLQGIVGVERMGLLMPLIESLHVDPLHTARLLSSQDQKGFRSAIATLTDYFDIRPIFITELAILLAPQSSDHQVDTLIGRITKGWSDQLTDVAGLTQHLESRKRWKILVIDDDESWRSLLEECLVDESYEVETADTVKLAREKLEEGDFLVATVDLSLNKESEVKEGRSLLRYIRRKHPRVQCIVVSGTALTATEMRDLFIEYEIKDFMSKASAFDDLEFVKMVKKVYQRALNFQEEDS